MHLIDATNAEAYLRETGRIAAAERVTVRELPGGVSNIVLKVQFADAARQPFVLKQAREQLRVKEPWFCSPERIWREADFLRACQPLLKDCSFGRYRLEMPNVLFEDRENYVFGMTAAPSSAVPWKELLLDKQFDAEIAEACGHLLGTLHHASWHDERLATRFADCQNFEALRVDPYYRHIARVHPSIQSFIRMLIGNMDHSKHCLVHGDFSPKNLLISDDCIMLVDCEVGHFGDPSFDLGFMHSHLSLKALYHPLPSEEELDQLQERGEFIQAFFVGYERIQNERFDDLQHRATVHSMACALARIDGKSPVDYLTPEEQENVRETMLYCLEAMVNISKFDNPN